MTERDVSRIIRIVHPICCGLDVHKESVSACVLFPDDKGNEQCDIKFRNPYLCEDKLTPSGLP